MRVQEVTNLVSSFDWHELLHKPETFNKLEVPKSFLILSENAKARLKKKVIDRSSSIIYSYHTRKTELLEMEVIDYCNFLYSNDKSITSYSNAAEIDEDLKQLHQEINELNRLSIYHERESQFQRYITLKGIYLTSLDYIHNYFQRNLASIEKTRKWYQEQENIWKDSDIKKDLFKSNFDSYKLFDDKLKHNHFIESNLKWSTSHLNLFLKYGHIEHFQTAVDLLLSVSYYKIGLKGNFGYMEKKVTYYSTNKFDSMGNHIKGIKRYDELNKTLELYKEENLTTSFLTLSPKNMQCIDQEDLEKLMLVLKNFWRQPLIKETFKGYYGVPEIVYNEDNDNFNLHYHFIVLRDKGNSGYLSQAKISEIWADCCNTWGNDKIKGSMICDIRKVKTNIIKYLHNYLSKGLKVDNDEKRQELIYSLKNMQSIKAGGLLSKNYLKEKAIYYETKSKIKAYLKTLRNFKKMNLSEDYLETFGKPQISFGGQHLLFERCVEPVVLSSNEFEELNKKYTITGMANYLLYGNAGISFDDKKKDKVNTQFRKDLMHSMFGTIGFTCPFTNAPLKFAGCHNNSYDWSSGWFIIENLDFPYLS